MKQALHFGLGQQLKMTPQLQQAIRLLQLSTLELQQEIQETLYANPLLEIDEEASNTASDDVEQTAAQTDSSESQVVATESQDIEYQSVNRSGATIDNEYSETNDSSTETLQDYLIWQLNLTPLSEQDRAIGEVIVDAVDDDGFLASTMEEVLEAAKKTILEQSALDSEQDIDLDEEDCLTVLHRIQKFDPPGVAAVDLADCLKIQLGLMPTTTEYLELASLIIDDYLPLVTSGDLNVLVRRTRHTEQEVLNALSLLKSLNPRPGSNHNPQQADYIVPDVILTKVEGVWKVSLNPESHPKLRVATQYSNVLTSGPSEDKEYVKEKLQEARWFMRSLESRHDTLLKVATAIVQVQVGFFDHGPEAMKPLVLKDLAEKLDYHESTISRATNQKYIYTPRGIFELKYFFSSQVSTATGGEASSTAIKAMIQTLVSGENPQKPLSDNKLTGMLQEKGILVARRTVAKYREMLNIPASSSRKRIS